MLDELRVENLGIIRSAHVEPGPGLVAITGETGAGKTLLLGALRLLRGDTARTDRVGPHGSEARVEGRFAFPWGELVASRRVGSSKSRAYLDGSMVPARTLAERLDGSVEIVAQHEHLSLARDASLRNLVDGLLDAEGARTLDAYRTAWESLGSVRTEAESLGGDPAALERDLETSRHQAREIANAALEPGEDADLTARLRRLRHGEEIAASLAAAADLLDSEKGVTDGLGGATRFLEDAGRLDPALSEIIERLGALTAEVHDVARDVATAMNGLEHDPQSLQAAEERAALIAALKRKYGATVEDVVAFGAGATRTVESLETAIERSAVIEKDLAAAEAEVSGVGEALRGHRAVAAKALSGEAVALLHRLGFEDPTVDLAVSEGSPGPLGTDRIVLNFASDAGLQPGPISRIASGGELSRLVLAVRVAAGVAEADVVAFDEIDAGVGGTTALAMGELLSRLAVDRQVFVVTHLPQVAAFADTHFAVERSGTEAIVKDLDGPERIAEVTRMLSGIEGSGTGKDHAEELLATAAERRRR